jgi:hypothetical protein
MAKPEGKAPRYVSIVSRVIYGIAALPFATWIGISTLCYMAPQQPIKDTVSSNINRAQSELESRVCMEVPFNTNIYFSSPPDPVMNLGFFLGIYDGAFIPEDGNIYLNAATLTAKGQHDPLSQFKSLIHGQIDPLRILVHEETHSYIHGLAQEMGKPYSNSSSRAQTYIDEGIATYFENKYARKSFVEDPNWSIKARDATHDQSIIPHNEDVMAQYNLGYQLVAPIIDIYGLDGIKALLNQQLQESDLDDLKAYQTRILEGLKKTSNPRECPSQSDK